MMNYLSLLLAVIHSASALILLVFSGWFIAASALAGVNYADINFNYLLPAVAIRALALTRIASGYAHMWTGHHALLARVKRLRLALFARLKDNIVKRRAEGTEALAKHAESIASISMAWTAHNLSAMVIILIASFTILAWLPNWFALWLLFLLLSAGVLLLGGRQIRRNSHEIAKLTTQFRHESEHHLSSASLWHLRQHIRHPDMNSVYQRIARHNGYAERMLWWTQLFAFALLIYLLTTGQYFGQAGVMIILLLLLTAKDWLAPVLRSQVALSDYQHSKSTFTHLPLQVIESAPVSPAPIQTLLLRDFSVAQRPVEHIDLTLQQGDIVLMQGGSGCGKTSLLKAIAGLLTHTGTKSVNGKVIPAGFITHWHYSDQQPVVLSASLAANLRLARPDASDELLHQALAFAGLAHLTSLNQWLGEQGRQLSGGELKRLNIARAFLFPAQLYLLDEPFEGLNTQQQEQLAGAIQLLSAKAPVIVASHIVPDGFSVNQVMLLNEDCNEPGEQVAGT